MKELIRLVAKGVWYYSENDEAAFFDWLNKIPCIENLDGEVDLLYIEVNIKKLDSMALREIIAIFYRYGIEMKQLSVFKNNKRWKWFVEPNTYWFNKVFCGDNENL